MGPPAEAPHPHSHEQASDITDSMQALNSFWEVEEGKVQVAHVQGSLRQSLESWKSSLQSAPCIIEDRYKLPLRAISDKYQRPNQSSALEHQEFVIQELEQNRCVVKIHDPPHICSLELLVTTGLTSPVSVQNHTRTGNHIQT